MPDQVDTLAGSDYTALGEFRFRIRKFLHFSEEAARAAGLEPQQHQMLLAIRALTGTAAPTVGELAEHLFVRHHSAVGLIDRLEEHGWVKRARGSEDRREVRVGITEKGERILSGLSRTHREELRKSGPALVAALSAVLEQASGSGSLGKKRENVHP